MLVQCLNEFVLHHALSTSFAIPMKWLSLAYTTTVYNKSMEVITFQMESKGKKNLSKKQFSQFRS